MSKSIFVLLGAAALVVPAPTFAQAPGGIDVQQRDMGSASDLSGPVAQMSASDLAGYETGLRNGVVRGWASGGVAVPPETISLSSQIVPAGGGLKIIRTKIIVPGKSFQWSYLGVSGGKLIAVVCTSKTAQPFNPGGTDCERRVNDVFGKM